MRPHTDEETLIPAACAGIVRTVCQSGAEQEMKKVPLSDNSVDK